MNLCTWIERDFVAWAARPCLFREAWAGRPCHEKRSDGKCAAPDRVAARGVSQPTGVFKEDWVGIWDVGAGVIVAGSGGAGRGDRAESAGTKGRALRRQSEECDL